jgi:hypothetical protein
MYKRFFAFGCSFTKYSWPTWADIISVDLDIPYENWAMSGIGNVGIFHRMVEADLKNNFREDDLIMSLWSSWPREDRYLLDHWQTHGNIFNNDFYNDSFIKKYWSSKNDIIKNSTSIIAANKLYNIKFQGHLVNPGRFETSSAEFSKSEKEMFDFYKPYYPADNIFPHYSETSYSLFLKNNDKHPDILHHLAYVESVIYPYIGLELKNTTKSLFVDLHFKILKILKTQFQDAYTDNIKLLFKIYKLNNLAMFQNHGF